MIARTSLVALAGIALAAGALAVPAAADWWWWGDYLCYSDDPNQHITCTYCYDNGWCEVCHSYDNGATWDCFLYPPTDPEAY